MNAIMQVTGSVAMEMDQRERLIEVLIRMRPNLYVLLEHLGWCRNESGAVSAQLGPLLSPISSVAYICGCVLEPVQLPCIIVTSVCIFQDFHLHEPMLRINSDSLI